MTRRIQCVYWDYNENTWQKDGCRLVLPTQSMNDNNTNENGVSSVTCECDHLTDFSILLSVVNPVRISTNLNLKFCQGIYFFKTPINGDNNTLHVIPFVTYHFYDSLALEIEKNNLTIGLRGNSQDTSLLQL